MSIRLLAYFLLLSAVFLSCGEEKLEGNFVGYRISKADSSFNEARSDLCSLYIDENYYFFRSNTKTIEKGNISIDKSVLYLRDTLRNLPEKKIAWRSINKDSIVLTMNHKGEALDLHMKRIH